MNEDRLAGREGKVWVRGLSPNRTVVLHFPEGQGREVSHGTLEAEWRRKRAAAGAMCA